jgi:protoporphyrin/coproporphyrin ferrochelatase
VSTPGRSVDPYDALLVVSFGGPERPEDIRLFLENVTRGRGVSPDRLTEVAGHYHESGGRSPINDQNRALLTALKHELGRMGLSLPVYWGNRNWHPYLADELARMRDDGIRRAAVFLTSAYSSYSGCRQYREDLAAAAASVGPPDAPRMDRLRHCFDHPGFIQANADRVVSALGDLPSDVAQDARLVFVTHAIPTAMAETAGPAGGAYVDQHRAVAAAVTVDVENRTGTRYDYELVYCSRSGPPQVPWLEPDVNDHLKTLAAEVPGVVLAPIGFVSDHMEVAYDLDTEALGTARELGLPAARAATAGTHPAFVAAICDLLLERAAVERCEPVVRASVGPPGPSHDVCPVGCCPNLLGPRPALCGASA